MRLVENLVFTFLFLAGSCNTGSTDLTIDQFIMVYKTTSTAGSIHGAVHVDCAFMPTNKWAKSFATLALGLGLARVITDNAAYSANGNNYSHDPDHYCTNNVDCEEKNK